MEATMFSKRLGLFQKNKNSIWADEYISKELLKCYLNDFTDGASRKLAKRNKILEFINNNIEKNSKILDLGCGPGLFAFELAKSGHNVLGIDFNIEAIKYANSNKKLKNIEYRYENYLESNFTDKYDVAIMIYCDFGALIPSEQIKLLNNVHNALKSDGIFIFDVFKLNWKLSKKPIKSWNIYDGNDFWCKDPYLFLQEVKLFNRENAVGERYFIINQKEYSTKEFILWNQYYSKDSIQELISDNNFSIVGINENLINNENTMFVIAKKHNI